MNMVPYDFVQQLEKKTALEKGILSMFDWFQCQEVLNGACINEFQLEEPQLIQNYLETQRRYKLRVQNELKEQGDDLIKHTEHSLLDYLLQNDVGSVRWDYFRQTNMMRIVDEVSNDFFQMTIIEKCMQPGQEKLNVTGDIIMKHMYEQSLASGHNLYQVILMKMVSQVTNVGQDSQFLRFINNEPETTCCGHNNG